MRVPELGLCVKVYSCGIDHTAAGVLIRVRWPGNSGGFSFYVALVDCSISATEKSQKYIMDLISDSNLTFFMPFNSFQDLGRFAANEIIDGYLFIDSKSLSDQLIETGHALPHASRPDDIDPI